ncbi:hypothetical protein [Propionivibrio sp.]|uniref:hypothetical protein n=1 Tax=Propionivibrio sp. TaxID=2212460 RepID=UPI003BF0E090
MIDGLCRKPDRDVAASTQCLVVFGPVGRLAIGLGEFVAAILVMFVGHRLSLAEKSIPIMPIYRLMADIFDLFNNAS